MKKKLSMLCCLLVAVCLCMGVLTGCPGGKKISNENTAFVIMAEEMDGVFNPFFSTSGPDGEVIGMTQVSMLSSNDEGEVAYGNDEPSVVLDYSVKFDASEVGDKVGEGVTTYTFVLKNGIKFTNGVPLTIKDALFNLYVYLDPVYTGSATIYSTDIVGLQKYRTQSTSADEATLENNAYIQANLRRTTMINKVNALLKSYHDENNFNMNYEQFISAVDNLEGGITEDVKKDVNSLIALFREELESDWRSNKDAYLNPGEEWKLDEVHSFLYAEGIGYEWDKQTETIKQWTFDASYVNSKERAIEYVFGTYLPTGFEMVARYFACSSKQMSEFVADAKADSLKNRTYKNISGIKALDGNEQSTVTLDAGSDNERTYKVAKLPAEQVSGEEETVTISDYGDCNADWSVKADKAADTYQVLQIKINGRDPKAIWNFGYIVAPMSYYSDEAANFSIKANRFGVKYASMPFMNSLKKDNRISVPVGAGPYKATNRNSGDNPSGSEFMNNNIVYFKRNDDFMMGKPIIRLLRMQVVNATQSIDMVIKGSIHYASPQATGANQNKISSNSGKIASITNRQLGYGYIGINASKIQHRELRHAIMYACDTSLCTEYYANTAQTIYWPMSKESWAYPDKEKSEYTYGHKKTRPTMQEVQTAVLTAMQAAGIPTTPTSAKADVGGEQLTVYSVASPNKKYVKQKFTIAGSNLNDHPAYRTMFLASQILNACGWDVEVVPDSSALSKLASGLLTVWAAAWSSSIDPDMYQVYHKNSKATSTLNWGYEAMRTAGVDDAHSTLKSDWGKVGELSTIIEQAREVDDSSGSAEERAAARAARKSKYAEALEMVMELGVELPTYQRGNLYVYNKSVVKGSSLNNSGSAYSSPLSKIWLVSLNESK